MMTGLPSFVCRAAIRRARDLGLANELTTPVQGLKAAGLKTGLRLWVGIGVKKLEKFDRAVNDDKYPSMTALDHKQPQRKQ